jgi:hypothetical protein
MRLAWTKLACILACTGFLLQTAVLSQTAVAQVADTKSPSIPRTPQGKPDFTGFWNIPYVPNMAQGKEDSVPYTAAGRAAYVNHDAKDDPTSNCWFPGVPRIMQSPYPSQWVQTPDHIVILFEYMHTFRSIPLNGRPHPANKHGAGLHGRFDRPLGGRHAGGRYRGAQRAALDLVGHRWAPA